MKHIRLYLFVLFTACSMFMVCPFALAEEMPASVQQVLYDNIFNLPNYNNIKSYVDSYVLQYKNFALLNVQNASYPGTLIYFSNQDDLLVVLNNTSGDKRLPFTNSDYSYGLKSTSVSTWDNDNGIIGIFTRDNYYLIRKSETLPITIDRFRQIRSSEFYTPYWSDYINFQKIAGSSDNTFTTSNSISSSNYFSSFNSFCYQQDSVSSLFEQNVFPISYSDDDRLKFAIVDNIYGGKNLMIDIRLFINDFPIQDTSHSSVLLYPENITLTYTVDNVEKTIILSSSNSTIKSKYIFETGLSNFDFDESADNVIITKCDFTISGNTQGGQTETENYYISCDYYIKRFVQPIEQGSNPYESNLNGDQTSQEIKDSLQYLVTFREGYGLDFDEFSDLSFPDYYTYADVYLYNNTAAYNYLMDNILSVNAVAYIIQSLANSEEDVITQIGLFLDDSNYGEYYDVIVFDWIQETSSTYTHTYFYFETVSGRVKSTTQFLQVMQDDLNKVKINTAAAFTAIDNFESESIQFFNAKLGLDADLLGWVKTIDNSINNLDFPVYDDSNIVSLLGQIKDLLSSPANEIDTPQECIQLYEAHPNYFDELWGTPTPALRSASVTPSSNNPYISSDFVRADLVPAWWEGKTLTMIYILKNDGETSRFYNDILNGLFDSYENLIESDNSFNTFIDSLFKTGYDYTDSFYGHLFDLDYNPEAWDGGFAENE